MFFFVFVFYIDLHSMYLTDAPIWREERSSYLTSNQSTGSRNETCEDMRS